MAQKTRKTSAQAAAPARALVLSDDTATALKQLATHRLRAPNDPQGYVLAATLQRAAGRLDDAEALLAAGMRRAQSAPGVAVAHAEFAFARADWAEAARRAERVRSLRPEAVEGWAIGIAALLHEGQSDEATALHSRLSAEIAAAVRDAVAALIAGAATAEARWIEIAGFAPEAAKPTEQVLRTQGFAATNANDWPAAASVWAEARKHYPDLPLGWVHGANALSQMGQHAEAEALADAAMAMLDGNLSVRVGRAYLAAARQDWALAATRWADVRAVAPDRADCRVHAVTALRNMGDHAAADALMEESAIRLPDSYPVLSQYATAATDRGDWVEALRRWKLAEAVMPDSKQAQAQIALAAAKLGDAAA